MRQHHRPARLLQLLDGVNVGSMHGPLDLRYHGANAGIDVGRSLGNRLGIFGRGVRFEGRHKLVPFMLILRIITARQRPGWSHDRTRYACYEHKECQPRNGVTRAGRTQSVPVTNPLAGRPEFG